MSLANLFLDILTNCIKLNDPEIYLSTYLDPEDKENGINGIDMEIYKICKIIYQDYIQWFILNQDYKKDIHIHHEQIGGRYNVYYHLKVY